MRITRREEFIVIGKQGKQFRGAQKKTNHFLGLISSPNEIEPNKGRIKGIAIQFEEGGIV